MRLWITLFTRRVLLFDEASHVKAPSPEPGQLFTQQQNGHSIQQDGVIVFDGEADDDDSDLAAPSGKLASARRPSKDHAAAQSKLAGQHQQQHQQQQQHLTLKRIATAATAISALSGA